ncbi:LysR family transcriptional regulator [Cobetia amphilecti]|uniref:LysR family transcriptional regulator n=1 Tax=Cobetia amphilecti TaxID=1055104 RepID=A0ABT6URU8_9GAMM|nr:LysR family transcriptional regulator [Cobetia amphilecti]MDI5885391.1 LysR family transcriptional regulator [Cobetia amphilecti]WOI25524.1 LysR family transcriptional regulator [Cobetia amphilecti]
MDRLTAMQVFRAVVEEGSFAGGARQLGLSNGMVSKQISRLEAELGVRLLMRTTRSLQLTAEGEHYLAGACRVLNDLQALEDSLGERQGEVRGRLKMSAPMDFSIQCLMPALAHFRQTYPYVELDLRLEDRHVDLMAEDYDLVIRAGALSDSSLIARRLAGTQVGVYASPGYLAENGTPEVPEDLAHHRCLNYTQQREGPVWSFMVDGRPRKIRLSPTFSCDSGRGLVEAAAQGIGITCKPDFLVANDVANGRLVPLLVDYWCAPVDIHLVYAERDMQPARLRALIEVLCEHFARIGHTMMPDVLARSPTAVRDTAVVNDAGQRVPSPLEAVKPGLRP